MQFSANCEIRVPDKRTHTHTYQQKQTPKANKMSVNDSKAPIRTVKRVQFGILSPDEIVSIGVFIRLMRSARSTESLWLNTFVPEEYGHQTVFLAYSTSAECRSQMVVSNIQKRWKAAGRSLAVWWIHGKGLLIDRHVAKHAPVIWQNVPDISATLNYPNPSFTLASSPKQSKYCAAYASTARKC